MRRGPTGPQQPPPTRRPVARGTAGRPAPRPPRGTGPSPARGRQGRDGTGRDPGGTAPRRPAPAHAPDPGFSTGAAASYLEPPVLLLRRARCGSPSPGLQVGRAAPAAEGSRGSAACLGREPGRATACGCEALAELGAGRGGRGGGSWASARPGQARGGALLASGRPAGRDGRPRPSAPRYTHTPAPPDSPPPAGRVQGPARGSLAAAERAGFWSAAAGWKLRHVCESSCRSVLTGEKIRTSEGGS